jgi:hypothetical protein
MPRFLVGPPALGRTAPPDLLDRARQWRFSTIRIRWPGNS